MTKHTPVPWVIGEHYKTGINSGTKHVAMVNYFESGNAEADVCGEEHEANVRLIAAAPELLRALEAIIEIGKRDLSNEKYDSYFETARTVISKAKGEE